MLVSAASMSVNLNWYPSSSNRLLMTFWPLVIMTARSGPNTASMTLSGRVKNAGLHMTFARVLVKSRLVTICGATAFTTPVKFSLAIALENMPQRSSMWIHGITWFPLAILAPKPNRNGRDISLMMPPSRPSTRPVRITTFRIEPNWDAFSQSVHSRDRKSKSPPGLLSSYTLSSSGL